MKKFLSFIGALLILCGVSFSAKAQTESPIQLSPYVQHDGETPTADKILYDKLNRIISNYGMSTPQSLQSPFILTAHAIEVRSENSGTIPPKLISEISLTFYIGNGVDNVLFTSCNIDLRGVGDSKDKVFAAAFRKINVNDPAIKDAIQAAQEKIQEYYAVHGPALVSEAERLAASGNYEDAYAALLRIPAASPNYHEAQALLSSLVSKEAETKNSSVITRARAAWSANPSEEGAEEAKRILGELENPSDNIFSQANSLLSEIGSRLQHNEDAARAAEQARERREHQERMAAERHEYQARVANDRRQHQERMAAIDSAKKVAVARAKYSRPIVYNIRWW